MKSTSGFVVAFVAGVVLFGVAVPIQAADVEPTTFWKRLEEKGVYERVWEKLRFYENEDNEVIQAVSVVGRYHGQYWAVNSREGNSDDWESRRIYLGAEAKLFQHFTLHAQIKISEDIDPFYDGIYQALVEWAPTESFVVSAGQLDFVFNGLERSMSSTKIATFERGLLANQLMPGEVVGAIAEGKVENFSYRAGVVSGSIKKEFTDFDGGLGVIGGVGYKLPLFYETGTIHLDYLFNDGHSANNALEPYNHVVSLWHQGQAGPFGVGVELIGAHGLGNRPAVFGVTLLPTYLIAKDVIRKGDALQAVLRFQFATSNGDNGLQLQKRYEQEAVPDGFGNHYEAIYGGVNYLIFGDRLKLMTGVEYASMYDSAQDGGEFHGWTFLTGVRVYF